MGAQVGDIVNTGRKVQVNNAKTSGAGQQTDAPCGNAQSDVAQGQTKQALM